MSSAARAPWADMPRVRDAWAIPRRQTPSEWAARNRVLGAGNAEPGPWRNERAPYLVEIMDALADPEISTVVVMKAAQVGLSEAMRNVVGYWISCDPGPLLMVMPTQDAAEEILSEKLAPMIRGTPVLAAHLTSRKHDVGMDKILLDHMEIHAAWATSPSSLASRPKRYLICDEVDKYEQWSGNESDPIALGTKRLTTYGHRAKTAIFSTPTIRSGHVFRAFDASPVKKRWHVPCHHCGEYSVVAWANVRWPRELPGTRHEQAEAIAEQGLAWYECPLCHERIDERHRAMMNARGCWAAEGLQTVARDGTRIGELPRSRRVAFQVPAIISPWVSWSEMAGEFVAAIGDESKMMDWRNSRLGEPYEIRAASVKSGVFDEKIAAGHAPGIVPAWARVLLATADTQKDHFLWVVRAWGEGYRSRLIEHGRAATFAELRERCLRTAYTSEDPTVAPMAAAMLGIDSGGAMEGEVETDMNRTHQVYEFAMSDPGRIFALKGWGGARELESPIRQSFVQFALPGRAAPAKVALYHLRTGYFKDILAARIGQDAKEPDAWELHSGVDADYIRQMSSEHKVIMRKGRGQVARWVPVTHGAPNHLWDCEVYQIALSQIAHVDLPPRRVIEAREWFKQGGRR